MINVNQEIKRLKHLESLTLPKLKAVQNSGDGTLIHEANHLAGQIISWRWLAEKTKETSKLEKYEESIKNAEAWLKEIGENL